MRKIIFSIVIVFGCIAGCIFLINKNTDIIKNMKIKTIEQVKRDKAKYPFKESPFYKNYYSKEELIVLNIWATWCKPCLEEMPKLNQIKRQLNNSKIIFLSYSIDNDTIKVKQFNSTKKFDFKDITLQNYYYKNSILTSLNANENNVNNSIINISSTEIPLTYIIKNGKVIHKEVGTIDYQEFSKKLNSF
ncbi:thiol-disulfide isomerase/thioredoxin [Chryseobacterium sp. H1D6B]|uniref:TlpA family protein disulfide reductase n=1 Tax=Chryseobacterium sp. H1D6B TaxID=2940588 RepID=UPI0015CA2B1A|nr:TlpA family protein disulfide reductase [Chryseobacterium sp. H1D6B]MDH6252671.1 thiol-disulfide isomerase/thioredoxin [Chryseobacterium sp. H1D6B]